MEKSFLNFKERFPEWTPGPSGTMYLSRLMDFTKKNKRTSTGSKILPPLKDFSQVKNLPSKLGISSPIIGSIHPSILLHSGALNSTPDDDYKLRITSSSSDDHDLIDEYSSDGFNEAKISTSNLLKSRTRGKKIITRDKHLSDSSTLLDLMNKYVDKFEK